MNRKKENINGKKGQQENNSWDDTGMQLKPEDSALFGKISDYMMGSLDIEEVKSDPLFNETDDAARVMISGFDHDAPVHKAYAKYINENIPGENENEKLAEEINDIKNESNSNDLGKITAGWVREWDEKQLNRVSPDQMREERKEFITNALVEAENDFERKAHARKRKPLKKIILARYVLPAAAVLTGAFLLIKLLLPSGDPDKLFNKYYEPISAISPVTRSADAGGMDSYASAIESYNNKNYQAAAAGFSDAILKDPLNSSSRFFLGITRIELGNYEQAENMLEEVILSQGEYMKEARWYLGLAYLKTGDSEKAMDCFELLAQSPGFYSDRAEKILRRLR
jgi:TolA-binding protein